MRSPRSSPHHDYALGLRNSAVKRSVVLMARLLQPLLQEQSMGDSRLRCEIIRRRGRSQYGGRLFGATSF